MPRLIPILLLCLSQSCLASLVLPVLNDPIVNLSRLASETTETSSDLFTLSAVFGTEAIDNLVVRFTTQTSIGSLQLDLALFSNRTPGTRANFMNYVNDGDFVNSIIHRSMPGFVIQGGGFYDSDPTSNYFLDAIPTDPPIANEFGISNTLGTISMAKLGGDPDSATSGWFVSIGENSDNLDNQNGGFTVFGRITKSTLPNALSIGNPIDFPIWNAGGAFTNLPLNPEFDNTRSIIETDLDLFTTVTLETIPASEAGNSTTLSYSIVANSDPTIATASINGSSELVLVYSGNATGHTTIMVRATDSVGNTVDDTFTTSVLLKFDDWKSENFSEAEQTDDMISGPDADNNNDGLTNLELYLHDLNQNNFHLSPVVFSETDIADASHPSFTFPIRNDLADITYTIEQSYDLGLTDDWSATPFIEISRLSAGAIDTVSIHTTAPTSGTKDFYRVRFTQTP